MQMHEKLNKEIAEQEQEALECETAINVRREQYFGVIKGALKGMKAIQHPEHQDDSDMKDGDAEAEDREGEDSGRQTSAAGTPRDTGDATPISNHIGDDINGDTLKLLPRSRVGSQAPTPREYVGQDEQDVEMGGTVGIPTTASTPLGSMEEGEASESAELMEG